MIVDVSPTLAEEGIEHDEITGGLFGTGVALIAPHDFVVDAPLESVAVIETLKVPAVL